MIIPHIRIHTVYCDTRDWFQNALYTRIITVDYVAWRPIYELCIGPEIMEGSSRFLRWRDQEHGPTQAGREVG